eukprot:jgi/Mesen1/6385/ME000329S05543
MFASVLKMLTSCLRPSRKTYKSLDEELLRTSSSISRNPSVAEDDLLWASSLKKHAAGEFSYASVQGNLNMEDFSQVESGPGGTFVGIFDGHGGPQAAQFVNEHLYANLQRSMAETESISPDVLAKAFAETEEAFLSLVEENWRAKPQWAAVGSCGLVGVIAEGMLYVSSLGDSRAVLGTYMKASGTVAAVQLSKDHNANDESVREELRAKHPGEADVVVQKSGVWRVKGIIQVSRSFGDVYLKRQEFQQEPLYSRFRLPEPLRSPVLSAVPTTTVHSIGVLDRFVIFASDGLWEHMSNQEAVNLVHTHPRQGIARRLIRIALKRAANKREISYSELQTLGRGKRRMVHDDISLVVLYFDYDKIKSKSRTTSHVSIKAGQALSDESSSLQDLDEDEVSI